MNDYEEFKNMFTRYHSQLDTYFDYLKSKYLSIFKNNFNNYELPIISKYALVIVEPRKHKNLEFVIKNTCYFCKGWSLYIFHSTENKQYVEDILGKNKQNCHMIEFTKNNIDRMDYSKLLRSKERYWNKIDAEYVLIFQTDSCICRFGIENFLKYDYIGAPYGGNPFQNKNLNIKIGNGGLSLRKKKSMLEILDHNPILEEKTVKYFEQTNEDLYFAYWLKKLDYNLPSVAEATKFSVEGTYFDKPIGFHSPEFHLLNSNNITCPLLNLELKKEDKLPELLVLNQGTDLNNYKNLFMCIHNNYKYNVHWYNIEEFENKDVLYIINKFDKDITVIHISSLLNTTNIFKNINKINHLNISNNINKLPNWIYVTNDKDYLPIFKQVYFDFMNHQINYNIFRNMNLKKDFDVGLIEPLDSNINIVEQLTGILKKYNFKIVVTKLLDNEFERSKLYNRCKFVFFIPRDSEDFLKNCNEISNCNSGVISININIQTYRPCIILNLNNVKESTDLIAYFIKFENKRLEMIQKMKLFLNTNIKNNNEKETTTKLLDKLEYLKNVNITKNLLIEKNIHQIWGYYDNTPPSLNFQKYINTWKKYNSGWKHKLWLKDEIDKVIQKETPELWEIYNNLDQKIKKVDYARLALLYIYGGIYADVDYECLKNMESLLYNYEIVVCCEDKGNISNAIICAQSKNPIIYEMLIHIKDVSKEYVLSATGPQLVTKILLKNYNTNTNNCREKILIVTPESDLMLPYDWHKNDFIVKYRNNHYLCKTDFSNSYCITHWAHSWREEDKYYYDHQPYMMITKKINNKNKVLYGLKNKSTIDVTEKFIELFIKDNKLLIEKDTHFNKHFSDPLPNIYKRLYIQYNNFYIELGEADPKFYDVRYDFEG
jgi:inositol phosphorylceramide mannosyltransferase catalytic subunit